MTWNTDTTRDEGVVWTTDAGDYGIRTDIEIDAEHVLRGFGSGLTIGQIALYVNDRRDAEVDPLALTRSLERMADRGEVKHVGAAWVALTREPVGAL